MTYLSGCGSGFGSNNFLLEWNSNHDTSKSIYRKKKKGTNGILQNELSIKLKATIYWRKTHFLDNMERRSLCNTLSRQSIGAKQGKQKKKKSKSIVMSIVGYPLGLQKNLIWWPSKLTLINGLWINNLQSILLSPKSLST